MIDNQQDQPNQ